MLSGNANQIRKSIKSGLRNNVRIISPTDFIQTLLHFPVHDGMPFSNALGTVKKDFHDGKRWRDFQKPGRSEYALETKFKESFVNIARAVSRVCQKYAPKDAIDSDWVDCQPNPPGRRRKDGYDLKIRPSIVQVRALTSLAFRQLGKDMWVAKEDEEQKLSSVWWMQIHTIVDVKPEGLKNDQELEDTIVQLCAHIRQVFREQLDRRFVIALLLCDEELTLWFCDRVGLVGTVDPINIHDTPDVFLNILAAFSMLSAHKLGWDPTMKLYLRSGAEAVPSYTVLQRCHLSTPRWCISMPTEENQNRREDFITIRALTTSCSRRLFGRASIVWEVIRKEDFERGNFEQVLVLKQAWQPVMDEEAEAFDGVSEARIYEKAQKLCKDRIYSYETMKIENEIVSTQFFRSEWAIKTYQQTVEISKCDPDAEKSSEILDGKTGQKRPLSDAGITDSSGYREPFAPYSWIGLPEVKLKDDIFHVDDDIETHSRVLVRLLMKRRGYPLRYVVDNLELVTALRDAVRDHEIMNDQGILHRDISFNNILICDDDEKDAGTLIDLDGAKYSAESRAVPMNPDATDEHRAWLLRLFRQEHTRELEPDVFIKALKISETTLDAAVYLSKVFKTLPECLRNANDATAIWTAKKLYWPDEEIPDFGTHKSPAEGLTGTMPYISVDLMRLWCFNPKKVDGPIHNAVHDMESLFWVLLYICLTQAGTQSTRRYELLPNANATKNDLTMLVHDLFEKGDVGKRSYCLTLQRYFEAILANIHPYFNCLKNLLSKLRWALYLGHLYDGVEHYNIHSVILAILEEAIVELKKYRNDQEIAEAKENRRKKWKALRQVPDADEGSSEAQSDQPMLATINRPDSPSLAPRRSKRLRMAPSHTGVDRF